MMQPIDRVINYRRLRFFREVIEARRVVGRFGPRGLGNVISLAVL